ncbi:hypothetical protein OV090_09870 [Nannocystis sp. RBIL2]|uniref:hypothetical protein n=1 Tax=Nannocystis sp. RBIL2 TaxID=2996788 RepID=UPI00226F47ED|nr:hypothetical protein [Nannocystis sp. RBIL2]MCY1065068.1 hypothetical protein [Nannocystis sp. RBIL2]
MRTSALVGLLLAACSPATPVAAPQAEPVAPAPEVAPAKQDAPPAPTTPAGPPAPNKLTVPGDPAPNLAIGKDEQAAIDAACPKLCKTPQCKCDAARPMQQFLLVRRFDPTEAPERGYGWYVLQRTDRGWITVMDTETRPGGDDVARPHEACGLRGPDPLPAGLGLVGVRLPDLDLDGRPDLLFECRTEWRHDVHYCTATNETCATIPMRFVNEGELYLDLDLEYRDGWFLRTVRVDRWKQARGNVRVDGVDKPDPAPGR